MMQGEEQNTGRLSTMLIVIVFILLLLTILLLTGYYKKIFSVINPDIEACKGGTCKNSCTAGSEVQKADVQCRDLNEVCCLPNTKVASPECSGRSKGDICGTLMLCDQDNVCVSRCEYCALNPNDSKCVPGQVMGKSVSILDSSFSCGCTEAQCIEFDNSRLGSCVKNFCAGEEIVGTGKFCCTNPYN